MVAAITFLFSLLLSCRAWSAAPVRLQAGERRDSAFLEITPATPTPLEPGPSRAVTIQVENEPGLPVVEVSGDIGLIKMGDPAGCLTEDRRAELSNGQAMLAYADTLISLHRTLAERVYPGSWNGYLRRYMYDSDSAISLDVSDVNNQYLLQRMLNVLHVAGFVTWLRESEREEQSLHILALPLINPDWTSGDWAPYIQAYWQDPGSAPEGDTYILPVQKLPPCSWMVSAGFAPPVDAGWWAINQIGWPDYSAAAQPYLAETTQEANRVARKIDWLGSQLEGPTTMCGPLAWSIMNDAGAFPPGYGAWTDGPITFWLAKPTTNGRPWSVFPPGSLTVYHFDQPIYQFDFNAWPLYPGDFLYLYSAKDGYDHMIVITEVHPDGSVYTVTNLIQKVPEERLTIERALLYNLSDPTLGLIYNQWRDRTNGRTGHAGFDVMRWDWMVKDIENQPVAYTVLAGDTLGMVSVRWKTPADWIARYNNIASDVSLTVGQELMIPPNEDGAP